MLISTLYLRRGQRVVIAVTADVVYLYNHISFVEHTYIHTNKRSEKETDNTYHQVEFVYCLVVVVIYVMFYIIM